MRRSTVVAAAAAATLAVGGVAAGADAERPAPLAVCFAENDPPRSLQSGATGFDVDVARSLAARLERPLRLVWMPESPQTDIESTDLDFRPLLRGECDAQLSVPGEDAIAPLRKWMALSAPYYGAAYELLPRNSPLRWGQPHDGTVAVVSNSVAHVAVNAVGLRWTMQRTSADVLGALAEGAASASLVWGPDLALLGEGAAPSADFQPPDVLRWNLHAATRKDDPLLADLNRAFMDADFQRQVRALLARHGLPSRAPFETAHTRAGLAALKNAATP